MRKKILFLFLSLSLCFCTPVLVYASTETTEMATTEESTIENPSRGLNLSFKQYVSLIIFVGVAIWVYGTVPNETVTQKKKGLLKKNEKISTEEYIRQVKQRSAEMDEEENQKTNDTSSDYNTQPVNDTFDDYEPM